MPRSATIYILLLFCSVFFPARVRGRGNLPLLSAVRINPHGSRPFFFDCLFLLRASRREDPHAAPHGDLFLHTPIFSRFFAFFFQRVKRRPPREERPVLEIFLGHKDNRNALLDLVGLPLGMIPVHSPLLRVSLLLSSPSAGVRCFGSAGDSTECKASFFSL